MSIGSTHTIVGAGTGALLAGIARAANIYRQHGTQQTGDRFVKQLLTRKNMAMMLRDMTGGALAGGGTGYLIGRVTRSEAVRYQQAERLWLDIMQRASANGTLSMDSLSQAALTRIRGLKIQDVGANGMPAASQHARETTAGGYSEITNTIYRLPGTSIPTFAHEVVHAAQGKQYSAVRRIFLPKNQDYVEGNRALKQLYENVYIPKSTVPPPPEQVKETMRGIVRQLSPKAKRHLEKSVQDEIQAYGLPHKHHQLVGLTTQDPENLEKLNLHMNLLDFIRNIQ